MINKYNKINRNDKKNLRLLKNEIYDLPASVVILNAKPQGIF